MAKYNTKDIVRELINLAGYPNKNKDCKIVIGFNINMVKADYRKDEMSTGSPIKDDVCYREIVKCVTGLKQYTHAVPYAQIINLRSKKDIQAVEDTLSKLYNLTEKQVNDIMTIQYECEVICQMNIHVGVFTSNNIFSKLIRVNPTLTMNISYMLMYDYDNGGIDLITSEFSGIKGVRGDDFGKSMYIFDCMDRSKKNQKDYIIEY